MLDARPIRLAGLYSVALVLLDPTIIDGENYNWKLPEILLPWSEMVTVRPFSPCTFGPSRVGRDRQDAAERARMPGKKS